MSTGSPLLPCWIALLLLAQLTAAAAVQPATIPRDQRVVLLSGLKSSIQDWNGALSSWKEGTDHCKWKGITCDAQTGLVTKIELGYLGISGQLPPEWAALTSLRHLSASYNKLWGDLPAGYSSLLNLRLISAKYNMISGSLPADWGWGMKSLETLDFEYNYKMSGSVPASYGGLSKLRIIHLGTNQLTGQLPAELSSLSSLRELLLDNNKFSGSVPASWGWGMKSLERVSLFDNYGLSGCLPVQWRSKVALEDKNTQEFTTDPNSPGVVASTSIEDKSMWCSKRRARL